MTISTKNALLAALILAGGVGMASSASADACTKLEGSRWLFVQEGTGILSPGIVDFRKGIKGGISYSAFGTTPLPAVIPNNPMRHGDAVVGQYTLCIPSGGEATMETVSSPGAGIEIWTPSADGTSATIKGTNSTTGRYGWAMRLPR